MRLFWKIILLTAIPIGSFWLYKKSSDPIDIEERGGVGSTEQIIDRLSKIDGVTSRVAENLVEKGIKSKEALTKLTEEELRSVKGIGPKRAAKILKL